MSKKVVLGFLVLFSYVVLIIPGPELIKLAFAWLIPAIVLLSLELFFSE